MWSNMVAVLLGNNGIVVATQSVQDDRSFILNFSYRGRLPEVKAPISDMAINGSGIRDTARVLKISPTTVIKMLKKVKST